MKVYLPVWAVVIMLTGCQNGSKKNPTSAESALPVPIVPSRVVGIGKIEPQSDIIQLSAEAGGVVSQILKKENDPVNAGDIILELDHRVEDAKIKQILEEVSTQRAQIKADQAALEEYQAKVEHAVTELERLHKLLDKGAETEQRVDDASTDLKTYQSNLNRLKAQMEVSESKLRETMAAAEVSMRERDQKIIRSPVKGKILEISTLLGSTIDSKQSFGQIAPEGKTIALCEIDELFADKIRVGEKAWIRNLGSLDTLSTGTVYFVASFLKKKSLFTDQAGEKEDRRVREIKILLDQPEHLLLNARIESVVDISNKP